MMHIDKRYSSCPVKLLICFNLFFIYSFSSSAQKIRQDSLSISVFGKIHLFEPFDCSKPMILYFTGDKGWNEAEKILVKSLLSLGTTLAVIDSRHLGNELAKKKNACTYPAANLEELSKILQKKLKKKTYQYPVLMGHASGSSWVFALLCQAPQHTFAGGILLGFNNSFNTAKPLCKGNGLITKKIADENYIFLPSSHLPEQLHIFQAATDKEYNQMKMKELTAYYKNITTQVIQNTDINFMPAGKIIPLVKSAFESIIAIEDPFTAFLHNAGKESGVLQDLPLTFHPGIKNDSLPLCIMISGDGGWTGFDQSLAMELSSIGIPVCGLNSLKYFWDKKNPEIVAGDIAAIARHYLLQTGRRSIMLLGYSFGADVLPFVYNKLPIELMNITHLLTLLSPSTLADFEIHYTDMVGGENSEDKYDVFHEIRSIQKPKLLCIYGSDEESDVFHPYLQKNVSVTILNGGHHYDNSFDKIRSDILLNLAGK